MNRQGNVPYHIIETPLSAAGAIAMIRVVHPDLDQIELPIPNRHQLRHSSFYDVDDGVIVRWDQDSIMLMPHGGIAVVREISAKLIELGIQLRVDDDPSLMYPEAKNEIEALMLSVLAKAASPLAVDVLLSQPSRWESVGVTERTDLANNLDQILDSDGQAALHRLVEPPVVVAVGRANVGKSTLINALVGEQVSLVADIVGTTRDHVGVLVDLGGFVVRWIDTPGIDERVGLSTNDAEAIGIAMNVIANAQLVVHCINSNDDEGKLDPRLEQSIPSRLERIKLGTRADMGSHLVDVDCAVAITKSEPAAGIETLVKSIREALVPAEILEDSRPWRFWDSIEPTSGA